MVQALPLIVGGIGAVTSAVGTISAGQASSNAASYSAQVARNNAVIAEQNAEYATKAGNEQATVQGLRGAAALGKIKTQQAANNVDVNSGSAVNVRASEAESGKLDVLTVQNNAALKAYGYRTQATSDTAQAALLENEASSATTGADIGAAGGLLGSASSLGFKFRGMQNPGTDGGTAPTTSPNGSLAGY